MKSLVPILVVCIFVFNACRKDNIDIRNCQKMITHNDWHLEHFNEDYDIQFPQSYEGPGMVSFEGPFFIKYRIDNAVQMQYANSLGSSYTAYSDTLGTAVPEFIVGENMDGDEIHLINCKAFCVNGNPFGVLFYNTESRSSGLFYIKRGDFYLEALKLSFDASALDEIVQILKTIR